jgi:hypothetical protein
MSALRIALLLNLSGQALPCHFRDVIPAPAGIQFCLGAGLVAWNWIPAGAEMTPRFCEQK